jgi:hypothetical protein
MAPVSRFLKNQSKNRRIIVSVSVGELIGYML